MKTNTWLIVACAVLMALSLDFPRWVSIVTIVLAALAMGWLFRQRRAFR